jgi:hypothetical protein
MLSETKAWSFWAPLWLIQVRLLCTAGRYTF